MEFINRLEALIEAGGADAVVEARALLRHVEGRSCATVEAVDDFLVDLMTVAFLVEAGLEAFQHPARRLARARLSKLKRLLASAPAAAP
ncbi:hypothetical protein AB6802_08330 [Mesorhizobium sp. RCC_202]|uniref:hypothetical protein n=1 Tax=Mesorhizobium sp. RCC_202 TaxID=3239222 RepID=UPI0035253E3F